MPDNSVGLTVDQQDQADLLARTLDDCRTIATALRDSLPEGSGTRAMMAGATTNIMLACAAVTVTGHLEAPDQLADRPDLRVDYCTECRRQTDQRLANHGKATLADWRCVVCGTLAYEPRRSLRLAEKRFDAKLELRDALGGDR
jgi:hypothetical protein